MMPRTKLLKAAAWDALLVVLISLGAGSVGGAIARVIMRIASLTDEVPGVQGFSVEGTLRLIYLGVIPYFAFPATVMYAIGRRWLPGSVHVKALVFSAVLAVLATLGLQLYLESPLVAALFLLLAMGYAVTVAYLFARLPAVPRQIGPDRSAPPQRRRPLA